MTFTQVVGIVAAVCAATLFLPQVIKTVRTRETKSLSLVMYVLNVVCNVVWLTYGFLTWDLAILLAQVFLSPMGWIILGYKIKYG